MGVYIYHGLLLFLHIEGVVGCMSSQKSFSTISLLAATFREMNSPMSTYTMTISSHHLPCVIIMNIDEDTRRKQESGLMETRTLKEDNTRKRQSTYWYSNVVSRRARQSECVVQAAASS